MSAADADPPDGAADTEADETFLDQVRQAVPERIQSLRASVDGAAGASEGVFGRTCRIPGYRIVRLIGEGGSAQVFEAMQLQPRRVVALRVLHERLRDAAEIQRFRRGAAALAGHPHGGLPAVFAVGMTEASEPWMSMELVEGASLDLMAPALGRAERIRVVRDLARVVAHCHRHGIAHGDVKPQNILLTPDGTLKLVDFGLARDQAEGSLDLTRSVRGTPAYLSPERFDGAPVDETSDLFALGVVAHELLAGAHPYLEDRAAGWAHAAQRAGSSGRRRLVSIVPELRPEVAESLDRLLGEPTARPSAQRIAELLADPAGVWDAGRRTPGLRRRRVALAALAALLAAVAVPAGALSRGPSSASSSAAPSVIALSPDLLFQSEAALREHHQQLAAGVQAGRSDGAAGARSMKAMPDCALTAEALGDYALAASLLEPALGPETPRANGRVRRGEIISAIRLARVRSAEGRGSEASRLLAAIEGLVLREGAERQNGVAAEFLATRAVIAAREGRLDEARADAAEARILIDGLARVERNQDQVDRAWYLFQRVAHAWGEIAKVSGARSDEESAAAAAVLPPRP